MLKLLQGRGISVRLATKHVAAEEAPESYKVRRSAGMPMMAEAGNGHPSSLTCCVNLAICNLAHWIEVRYNLPPAVLPSCAAQDVDAVVATCHAAGISKKASPLAFGAVTCRQGVLTSCFQLCSSAASRGQRAGPELTMHKQPPLCVCRWCACAPLPSSRANAEGSWQAGAASLSHSSNFAEAHWKHTGRFWDLYSSF